MCKNKPVDYNQFYAEYEIKRLDQLAREFETSDKYVEINGESDNLYNKLLEALPEDLHVVLLEYNTIWSNSLSLAYTHFYKQGFADSMLFMQGIMGVHKDIKIGLTFV
jgi:hypothetical protein